MVNIVGHRGAGELRPENTLSSFSKAAEMGLDIVEFDVRETADKQLVVIHDDSVDRTTNGVGKVQDLSLSEIKSLDAGEGQEIPTFDSTLKFFSETEIGLRIEIKVRGIGERVVSAIESYNLEDRCLISSFEWNHLEEIAGSKVVKGKNVHSLTEEKIRKCQTLNCNSILIHKSNIKGDDIDIVSDCGLLLGIWPINRREDIENVLSFEPYSFTTDRPCLALEIKEGC